MKKYFVLFLFYMVLSFPVLGMMDTRDLDTQYTARQAFAQSSVRFYGDKFGREFAWSLRSPYSARNLSEMAASEKQWAKAVVGKLSKQEALLLHFNYLESLSARAQHAGDSDPWYAEFYNSYRLYVALADLPSEDASFLGVHLLPYDPTGKLRGWGEEQGLEERWTQRVERFIAAKKKGDLDPYAGTESYLENMLRRCGMAPEPDWEAQFDGTLARLQTFREARARMLNTHGGLAFYLQDLLPTHQRYQQGWEAEFDGALERVRMLDRAKGSFYGDNWLEKFPGVVLYLESLPVRHRTLRVWGPKFDAVFGYLRAYVASEYVDKYRREDLRYLERRLSQDYESRLRDKELERSFEAALARCHRMLEIMPGWYRTIMLRDDVRIRGCDFDVDPNDLWTYLGKAPWGALNAREQNVDGAVIRFEQFMEVVEAFKPKPNKSQNLVAHLGGWFPEMKTLEYRDNVAYRWMEEFDKALAWIREVIRIRDARGGADAKILDLVASGDMDGLVKMFGQPRRAGAAAGGATTLVLALEDLSQAASSATTTAAATAAVEEGREDSRMDRPEDEEGGDERVRRERSEKDRQRDFAARVEAMRQSLRFYKEEVVGVFEVDTQAKMMALLRELDGLYSPSAEEALGRLERELIGLMISSQQLLERSGDVSESAMAPKFTPGSFALYLKTLCDGSDPRWFAKAHKAVRAFLTVDRLKDQEPDFMVPCSYLVTFFPYALQTTEGVEVHEQSNWEERLDEEIRTLKRVDAVSERLMKGEPAYPEFELFLGEHYIRSCLAPEWRPAMDEVLDAYERFEEARRNLLNPYPRILRHLANLLPRGEITTEGGYQSIVITGWQREFNALVGTCHRLKEMMDSTPGSSYALENLLRAGLEAMEWEEERFGYGNKTLREVKVSRGIIPSLGEKWTETPAYVYDAFHFLSKKNFGPPALPAVYMKLLSLA